MKNPEPASDQKTDLSTAPEIDYMLPEQVKLQVPMKKAVHDALKARAEELGFDSIQSYVRFWATAETADTRPRPMQNIGLRPIAGPRTWISDEEMAALTRDALAETARPGQRPLDHPDTQALRYLELLLAINPQEPPSLAHALEYVNKQLTRVKGIRYLDSILSDRPRKKTGLKVD